MFNHILIFIIVLFSFPWILIARPEARSAGSYCASRGLTLYVEARMDAHCRILLPGWVHRPCTNTADFLLAFGISKQCVAACRMYFMVPSGSCVALSIS